MLPEKPKVTAEQVTITTYYMDDGERLYDNRDEAVAQPVPVDPVDIELSAWKIGYIIQREEDRISDIESKEKFNRNSNRLVGGFAIAFSALAYSSKIPYIGIPFDIAGVGLIAFGEINSRRPNRPGLKMVQIIGEKITKLRAIMPQTENESVA